MDQTPGSGAVSSKGCVPSPYGLICVDLSEDGPAVESPIPVVVDLLNLPLLHLGVESHSVL